jgi:glycosyltransferase involved in cell wall biosynthesis
MGSPHKTFVVIAAYNEAATIQEVVTRLLNHYPNVVVVDDGSTDGTAACLAGTSAYVLRHLTNRGQGAALQTAVAFALARGADAIVTFDADGQHDERDIKQLLEPIIAGECDVTLGSRFLGSAPGIPKSRQLLLKAATLFTRIISRVEVTDAHNGLRAFSRTAAQSLRITLDRMGHASELLDQIKVGGLRYKEVPVTITYSEHSLSRGQSSWNALVIGTQMLVKKASK